MLHEGKRCVERSAARFWGEGRGLSAAPPANSKESAKLHGSCGSVFFLREKDGVLDDVRVLSEAAVRDMTRMVEAGGEDAALWCGLAVQPGKTAFLFADACGPLWAWRRVCDPRMG